MTTPEKKANRTVAYTIILAAFIAFVLYLGFNVRSSTGSLSEWQMYVTVILTSISGIVGGFIIQYLRLQQKASVKLNTVVENTQQTLDNSNETNGKVDDLKVEIKKVQNENIGLKNEIIKVQEENAELKTEIRAVREENNSLRQENAIFRKENISLREEVLAIKEQVEKLVRNSN